jgi:DNA-binding PadR family transcriptional regulator
VIESPSYLETRWEPPAQPGRPARHVYRLTADGATLARARLADEARPRRATRPGLAQWSAS